MSAYQVFSEITYIQALNALTALPSGSLALLIGGVDTGKTSFAAEAVRHLGANGRSIAVIDADTGQSEIGPPGTVGLGFQSPDSSASLKRLGDLAQRDASFVGATSPAVRPLEWLAATIEMVRQAAALRPDLRLVDLPGYINGPGAIALMGSLTRSLDPAMILAFARGAELDDFLSIYRGRIAPPVIARVAVGPAVGRKTSSVRSARRMARFSSHFSGCSDHVLGWEDVTFLGTQLSSGSQLAPHLLRFISNTLKTKCLYASKGSDASIFVVLSGSSAQHSGSGVLEEYFGTQRIAIVSETAYEDLLCGLVDEHGKYLEIAILEKLDFAARKVFLRTPLRHPAAIRQVMLGWLRLSPEGREVGTVRAVAR